MRAAGATASVLRVVTAQPLPSLDPAFANTRQSRAVANALCTPLVRYADAEGLPGTVIVPGLARDLPIDLARQPHVPHPVARAACASRTAGG